MAPEQQSEHPLPDLKVQEAQAVEEVDYPPDADEPVQGDPPTLRLRVATWDLVCTLVLTALLLYLATATEWPFRLYGFLRDVCTGDSCGPVPYGVDMYIYPVSWGGIGAALAAAGIGPFVSLLKGWYMSFWPVLSLAIVMVSSVAGSVLTVFSARYWV